MLGELPRAREQVERGPKFALSHARPALGESGTEFELVRLGRMNDAVERFERLFIALALDRGLCACDGGLDLGVLVPGLASLEIRRVDTEPLCDPRERLRSRAGLAALDLADVFLGEAVAGEIGLGQATRSCRRRVPRPDDVRCGAAEVRVRPSMVRPSTYRRKPAPGGSLARVTRTRD
jgi:hypothetical protein